VQVHGAVERPAPFAALLRDSRSQGRPESRDRLPRASDAMAAKRDYDYLFKLVLIGDSGVGKSCLLLRFAVSATA
jgi:hypothetical protein